MSVATLPEGREKLFETIDAANKERQAKTQFASAAGSRRSRRCGFVCGLATITPTVVILHEECLMSTNPESLGDRSIEFGGAHLVEEIWDSIAIDEAEVPLTESQRQDLKRRIAAYEANPKAGSSWEEVKARLRSKP